VLVSQEIVLPCPPSEAWSVLTDWERQSDWMLDADRVEVVSSARAGVGVRLVVKTRILGIPAFTEPMRVVLWDPPRRLDVVHGGPVRGRGSWTLQSVEGGTRFVWTEDVALRVPLVGGLVARWYQPVMCLLMGRAMRGLRAFVISTGPGGA
jgi:Polyketide cyclase / dehydrase and lipid transport